MECNHRNLIPINRGVLFFEKISERMKNIRENQFSLDKFWYNLLFLYMDIQFLIDKKGKILHKDFIKLQKTMRKRKHNKVINDTKILNKVIELYKKLIDSMEKGHLIKLTKKQKKEGILKKYSISLNNKGEMKLNIK